MGQERKRLNLSFLTMKPKFSTPRTKEKRAWVIHGVQFACVVNGSGTWNWVAYGFGDSEYCGSLDDCDEEGEEPGQEMDQLATGKLFADPPIWDPREYFLRIFEIWVIRMARENQTIVSRLKSSIKQYVSGRANAYSHCR